MKKYYIIKVKMFYVDHISIYKSSSNTSIICVKYTSCKEDAMKFARKYLADAIAKVYGGEVECIQQ